MLGLYGSLLTRLMLTLCFSISCVTAHMNSLPGSTCNGFGYFSFLLYILSNALATSLLSFEVSGSASLYLLPISTTVKAYLYVLWPTVSYDKNNKSAWWISFGVETSKLGLTIFFCAGKYICHTACFFCFFFNNSNACFSLTFASLDIFLIAEWPLQNLLGLYYIFSMSYFFCLKNKYK